MNGKRLARCLQSVRSAGLLLHCLFNQSDDHHQDTAADPARCNPADNRADIEDACSGRGRPGASRPPVSSGKGP